MQNEELKALIDELIRNVARSHEIVKLLEENSVKEFETSYKFGLKVLGIDINSRRARIHTEGIESLYALDKTINRDCNLYPIEKSTEINGVKIFELKRG